MEALGITNYNRPYLCDVCGGLMVFKGCGEYECEDCHTKGLDDYGKVRNYIEQHAGSKFRGNRIGDRRKPEIHPTDAKRVQTGNHF